MRKIKLMLAVAIGLLLIGCATMTPAEREQWNRIPRKGSFEEVTPLLTSPALIDRWIRYNIGYDYYVGQRRTIKQVFTDRRANCRDTSNFILYCLRQAGYKESGLLHVDSRDAAGHIVVFVKYDDKIYIIDDGLREPRGILGPYKSFENIPYRLRGTTDFRATL